ncbi:MAG: sugar transferase [Phycisphaerae bacterium]|nr:sugar transferase [Phycisphaerae bacterium]
MIGGYLLNLPRVVWMMLDVTLLCCGTALGDRLFVWWVDPANILAAYNVWVANVVLGTAVIIAGSMFGLYESTTLWARSRIVARCLLTVTLAMLVTWLVMHLFMYSSLSRRIAASGVVFFLLTASAIRLLAHHAVREVRRGLLVIGQGPLTGAIIRSVRRGSVPGYRLVGLVVSDRGQSQERGVGDLVDAGDPPGAGDIPGASDIPIVGGIADVETLCREFNVAEVVVAESAARDQRDPQFQRAALAALRLGCRVTDETTFYESAYGEVPASYITPSWFLAADLKGQRQEHAVTKRIFDALVATAGLLIAAPIFAAVAAMIWLQRLIWLQRRAGGPVFYSQTRVGKGGRTFTLYKFRTMCGGAEADGSAWATPNDPRVTGIGRFLRKSRLDELPQLWNILRGDMSVVGPRPERPEFVGPLASLIPFYDERHLIKPGLTGWAQINYRYGSSIADAKRKLQLDLYYVKHTSLELDLIILLRTFGTFFLGSR